MAYDFSGRREIKSSSGGFTNALDLSGLAKKPEFFKLKAGPNKFDILPYEISSNYHPLVASKALSKGDPDYNLTLWVHTDVGPNKAKYVCPNKNYGKPCPICEAQQKAKDNNDKTTADALFPKRRVYYNIVDAMDRDKGVQLFETNVKYFQKPLEVADEDARKDPDQEGYTFFADPGEGGRCIKVSGSAEKFAGHDFVQATNISFAKRRDDIDDLLGDVIPLDKCIKLLSYEELESAFMGGIDEDIEDDKEESVEKPAKKSAPVEEDEAPSAKKEEKADGCPNGHKFGKDWGECKECDACFDNNPAVYKACRKASRE